MCVLTVQHCFKRMAKVCTTYVDMANAIHECVRTNIVGIIYLSEATAIATATVASAVAIIQLMLFSVAKATVSLRFPLLLTHFHRNSHSNNFRKV